MTRPFLLAIAAILVALTLNTAYTTWAVDVSQHRWCDTISLLAAQPPPPGDRGAARAYDRRLAADFRDLRSSLGCA